MGHYFLAKIGYDFELFTLPATLKDAKEKRLTRNAEGAYDLALQVKDFSINAVVDPQANFMIRSYSVKHSREKIQPREWERHADGFHDCGGGIHIPKKVVLRQVDTQKGVTTVDEATIKVVSVNKPIDAGKWDVKFPEWCRVVDQPKKVIHVWGKDGPYKTFKSKAEYAAWFQPIRVKSVEQEKEGTGSRTNALLAGAAVALVLGGVSFLVYRRTRARRAA
jgi:hypothetical protein